MEEFYLICEDSLEGVFTGIYNAYLMKKPHSRIHICVGAQENYRLFAVYEDCPAQENKAAKVAGTILREFGQEAYLSICRALASAEADKGEAVYKAVVTGFSMRRRRELMGNLADPYVRRVFELARFTANEAHYHVEFLRFRELQNGILYAPIGPKNNLITFIVPHFADRLPGEDFAIYDEGRKYYAVHPKGKQWYFVRGELPFAQEQEIYTKQEAEYQMLYRHFCSSIAIAERKNLDLQRNMLPFRFRKYMTEFVQID